MNIPIIGLIENMSYVVCPDCGKKIYIYGESKADIVAKGYGIELIGQMPINPNTADYVTEEWSMRLICHL